MTSRPKEKIERIEEALALLAGHEVRCTICPRECGVNRREGRTGSCGLGASARLSHAGLHFGEEPILSGLQDCAKELRDDGRHRGSGAVFFAGCNLRCRFCQNYQISWDGRGRTVSDEELATTLIELQEAGAYNINLVSPSHVLLPLLRALKAAYFRGLGLPLVYNSNGYEKAGVLKICEGIFDIFLPDLKYRSPRLSERLSNSRDYFVHASAAVKEMNRQQPDIVCDEEDIALKGCLVRHLTLPGQSRDSLALLDWLEGHLTPGAGLSLMSQYHPSFRPPRDLQRAISAGEYALLTEKASSLKFETIFIQPPSFHPGEHRIPDFTKDSPFEWK